MMILVEIVIFEDIFFIFQSKIQKCFLTAEASWSTAEGVLGEIHTSPFETLTLCGPANTTCPGSLFFLVS